MNRGSLFSRIEHIELASARPPKPTPPPARREVPQRPEPPSQRAKAEALFRPTLAASPAAVAAVAKLPARTMPPTVVMPPPPPPPVRDIRGRLNLTAKALKVTLMLDPARLAEVGSLDGAPPQELKIAVGGRTVRGTIKAKGLRLALALIAEHGAENVVVILSGRLDRDDKNRDVLVEAGVVAKAKAVPAPPPAIATTGGPQ